MVVTKANSEKNTGNIYFLYFWVLSNLDIPLTTKKQESYFSVAACYWLTTLF